MSQTPFTCPQCGSEKIVVLTETPTFEDITNANCADCGTAVTEEEIKLQARKIARDAIEKMMGKFSK
jgi:transcription elongation factor Elf1